MSIIRRRSADGRPPEAPDVNDWAGQLPPDSVLHVKEGSAYIDSFPAYEAQSDMTIEEILLARYGVGTYELAGRHNGLFLPGREKVHVGSQADRQAARHARATRDAQDSGGALGDIPEILGMLKDLGWAPGQQANQGNEEFTAMLVQHAVQSLRPPDPGETMDQVVGLMKSVQELQRDNAPPPPPRPRPKRNRKKSAEAKGKIALGEMLGTALFMGTNLAINNPHVTKRVSDGVSAKAQGAVDWFRRKTQAPAEDAAGEATGDVAAPTVESPAVTLEQALESAKKMLATPIGQRMVDYARGSIHDVAPEDIARHGIDGARQWLGADHPLLTRLHENPGRVFDEMADIVGLTGDSWWKARSHFIDMMAGETDGTPTSPSAPTAADTEAVTPEKGADASEDAANAEVDPDGEEG